MSANRGERNILVPLPPGVHRRLKVVARRNKRAMAREAALAVERHVDREESKKGADR
jgi:predicted transcriptional regulator